MAKKYNINDIKIIGITQSVTTPDSEYIKFYPKSDDFYIKTSVGDEVRFSDYINMVDDPFMRRDDFSYVNVKDFGALGDATWNGSMYVGTDDTSAFLDAIATGKNIYIPSGYYINKSQLTLPSNMVVFGDGRNESILLFDGVVNGTASTYYSMFYIEDVENVVIKDLGIRDGGHEGYEELLTFSEACEGISVRGLNTKYITVYNCDFSYIHGHGVHDEGAEAYNVYMFNTGNGCGQNILNINSKYPLISNNRGCCAGFGLIEASCGNGIIQNNVAYDNVISGITIGGFAGPTSSGYGSNNIICNNLSYNNGTNGIHLAAHCVDSIIKDNICYKNGNFGISSVEPNNIPSNLLIVDNKLFSNGIVSEISKAGIYISSHNNTIRDNDIYNIGLTGYSSSYGVVVDFGKNDQKIIDNVFKGITNWEISIGNSNNLVLRNFPTDRIELLGTTKLINDFKNIIGYDTQPLTPIDRYVVADNVSSSKLAILPQAEYYPEGQVLIVVDDKGTAGTYNITLQNYTGDSINGVLNDSYAITTNYGSVRMMCVRATKNWIIL